MGKNKQTEWLTLTELAKRTKRNRQWLFDKKDIIINDVGGRKNAFGFWEFPVSAVDFVNKNWRRRKNEI